MKLVEPSKKRQNSSDILRKRIMEYLFSDDAALQADARDFLIRNIKDPAVIESIETLSDTCPLKQEARIVSDAFEAVTNGMYDPYALELLSTVKDSSVFIMWKHLVEGIASFYEGNTAGALEAAGKIERDTPPGDIAEALAALCRKAGDLAAGTSPDHSRGNPGIDGKFDRFVASVLEYDSRLEQLFSSVEAIASTDAAEDFTDVFTLLLQEIRESSTRCAFDAAVWGVRKCWEQDLSSVLLLENLQYLFGAAESFRIVAVAMVDMDPGVSLLYWIKALKALAENNMPNTTELAAYLSIISDAYAAMVSSGHNAADAEFERSISILLSSTADALHNAGPDVFPRLPAELSVGDGIKLLVKGAGVPTGLPPVFSSGTASVSAKAGKNSVSDKHFRKNRKEKQNKIKHQGTGNAEPKQLELFSA